MSLLFVLSCVFYVLHNSRGGKKANILSFQEDNRSVEKTSSNAVHKE